MNQSENISSLLVWIRRWIRVYAPEHYFFPLVGASQAVAKWRGTIRPEPVPESSMPVTRSLPLCKIDKTGLTFSTPPPLFPKMGRHAGPVLLEFSPAG
jgi:hypothetical protein